MTVKQFFKSTTFKCIITLLCVLLISGIFLTIMNGLLEVSDEERFERALAKIYGGNVKTTEISLADQTTTFEKSQIEAAYQVDDGNYLIKSTGKNGYGGDVTCWVVVKLSNDGKQITGVGNVVVDTAKNESYLSKITSSHLSQISEIKYTEDKVYDFGWNDDKQPGADYIATGASCTMRAISNSVNGAISFVKSYAFGITIDISTPFDEFAYIEYINKNDTTVSFADGIVTFNVITLGNGDANPFTIEITVNSENTIESYEIVTNGSTYGYDSDMMEIEFVGKGIEELETMLDDGSLNTGATKSNTLCLQAALFAASNYANALNLSYENTSFINMDDTSWVIDGENVTYTIITKSNGDANPFTIEITVNGDKKIESYEIVTNGSTYGFDSKMMEIEFVGKGIDELEIMLDDGSLVTGATKSNTLCLQAALFAASNYDLAIFTGGGNNE